MAEWVWIDYVLAVLVAASTIISLFRGFFREAMSLATWVVALWLAWQLGPVLAAALTGMVEDPALRMWQHG